MHLERANLSSGQYVTCTTRKSNYTDMVFGWFTVWRSRSHFEQGICENSIDVKNVLLKPNIKEAATKFIEDHEDVWANTLKEMLTH